MDANWIELHVFGLKGGEIAWVDPVYGIFLLLFSVTQRMTANEIQFKWWIIVVTIAPFASVNDTHTYILPNLWTNWFFVLHRMLDNELVKLNAFENSQARNKCWTKLLPHIFVCSACAILVQLNGLSICCVIMCLSLGTKKAWTETTTDNWNFILRRDK